MHFLPSLPGSVDWSSRTTHELTAWPNRERTVLILPLCGFADVGETLPLHHEETQLDAILSRAAELAAPHTPLLVLPPLRFVLGPGPAHFFALDPETAHQHLLEIAASVAASGFKKLLFLNSSPLNKELASTAAIDARVAHGLDTYNINLSNLGLTPLSTADDLARLAEKLAALLPEIAAHRSPSVLECGGLTPLSTTRLDSSPPPAGRQAGPSKAASSRRTPNQSRHLAALSAAQLAALPDKEKTLLVLQTASIEQHGAHLPLGTDAEIGQGLLNAALAQLPADAPIYLLPPITYGKSNEHHDWPGTLTISAQTLGRVVLALAAQARQLGFRRLAVFNSHGGNTAVLAYTLREIEATLGLEAKLITHGYKPAELSADEAAYGYHAGEWETALMLALAPDLVRREKSVAEFPARVSDAGQLRPENAPVTFAWTSRDLSKTGVMGDATKATPEKGHAWLQAAATVLAAKLSAWVAREKFSL